MAAKVETVIIKENGQWAVDIIVISDDGVVRRRISTYRTEKLARISADLIRRAADRDIAGPHNG
ncbi:hypothetical protein [Aeromicrobium sp.]|uniref:hypothetical protein n=1 Tax=Aeromicrobium sp. TaxID=1871063 RepID=UPI0019BED7F8|nr:hypothetical protein [Aeromicrobium sp.]MBC7631843.1 hypothetical protein [Aeromicrobium sp.]